MLVEHPGNADALQLAAGEAVAALEQAVGEVEPGQRRPGAGDVDRVEQRKQPLGRRPASEAAGEDGGDDAQARRNRRRLMDGADARAQAAQVAGRQLPGIGAEYLEASDGRAQGGAEQAEQAGLAGARGADHGNALARRQLKVKPVHGAQAVGVGKPEISGNDGWVHGRCGTAGWRRLSGEETT